MTTGLGPTGFGTTHTVVAEVGADQTVESLLRGLGWGDGEIAHWLPAVQQANAEHVADFSNIPQGTQLHLPSWDGAGSLPGAAVQIAWDQFVTETRPVAAQTPPAVAAQPDEPIATLTARALAERVSQGFAAAEVAPVAPPSGPPAAPPDFLLFGSGDTPAEWVAGVQAELFDPFLENLDVDLSRLPEDVHDDVEDGLDEVRDAVGVPEIRDGYPRGRTLFEDAATVLNRAAELADPSHPDGARYQELIDEILAEHPEAQFAILGLHADRRVRPTPWHMALEVRRSPDHPPEIYNSEGEPYDWDFVEPENGGPGHWSGPANSNSLFFTIEADYEETMAMVRLPNGQWQLDFAQHRPPAVSDRFWPEVHSQYARSIDTANFSLFFPEQLATISQSIAEREASLAQQLVGAEAAYTANPELYAEAFPDVEALRREYSPIASFARRAITGYQARLEAEGWPPDVMEERLTTVQAAIEDNLAEIERRGIPLTELRGLPMVKQQHGVSYNAASVHDGYAQDALPDQVEYPLFYRVDPESGDVLILDLMDVAEYRGDSWDEALETLIDHNIYRRGYMALQIPEADAPQLERTYDWIDERIDGVDEFTQDGRVQLAVAGAGVAWVSGVGAPVAAGTVIAYTGARGAVLYKRHHDDAAVNRYVRGFSDQDRIEAIASALIVVPLGRDIVRWARLRR
ncbi:MAG: hypothetical protein AAF654_08565 [Myxococcota bacterium]